MNNTEEKKRELLQALIDTLDLLLDSGQTSEGDDPDDFEIESVEPGGAVHQAVVRLQECYAGRKLPWSGRRYWIRLQRICRHEQDDIKRMSDACDAAWGLRQWASAVAETDEQSGKGGTQSLVGDGDFVVSDANGVKPPYEVDDSLCQIRIDGDTHQVSHEAARMAKLLLESNGEWVPTSRHNFTKPSEVKKRLPEAVQSLIETAAGKGYRIRPRR